MKKLITLFLVICSTTFGQVYFSYPSSGQTFYSGSTGVASFNYHILTVSGYYLSVDYYGTCVQQPNGTWTDWQGAQTGGWAFSKAGTYYLKGGVHVVMDANGENNYWMYKTISINIADATAPATPSGLSVSANPGNNHVKLSWTANSESDIDSYEVQRKMYTGSWNTIATTTSNSYVDDGWYLMGNSTIHMYYRIRVKDINNNYSGYSSEVDCWPYNVVNKKNLVSNNSLIPTQYDLSNYPNPFNPTTKVNFQLPEDGMVTLKVYDILGKEVASLVNEDMKAGYYSYNFDASNLSAGIYIYRLTSNNFTQSKKMLLMK